MIVVGRQSHTLLERRHRRIIIALTAICFVGSHELNGGYFKLTNGVESYFISLFVKDERLRPIYIGRELPNAYHWRTNTGLG